MLKRTAALLIAAVLQAAWLAAPSLAQDQPIMGAQGVDGDSGQAQQPAADVYRILVIGDGLAGGLGEGLARITEGDREFEVANRFQEISGLARPEVYDWADKLPKLMEDKTFNAVVVLIGSNDRQEMRYENFRYAFNTPDWVKAYQANADKLLDALKSSGVKIYWLSLPPMGDERIDADAKAISALQRARVDAAGATYLDFRSQFVDAAGKYEASGPDDAGTVRALRDADGIAFTKAGSSKLGVLVLNEIKRRIDGKTDLPLDTIAEPPSILQPETSGPVFGQSTQDGQLSTFNPQAGAAPASPATVKPGTVQISTTQVSGKELGRGTSAERLYQQGLAETAPHGRFDDYSLPQPAEAN